MSTISDELFEIAAQLEAKRSKGDLPEIDSPLRSIESASTRVGKAWSGSWLGYHSRVYYQDLQPPPPEAQFSQEWGLMPYSGTSDGWMICDSDEVRRAVYEIAGDPDLALAKEFANSARTVLEDSREEIISLLTTALEGRDDPVLIKLKEQAEKAKAFSASDFVKRLRPSGHLMSRDSEALTQGFRTPPHIAVLVETMTMSQPASACGELAKVAKRAASHLAKRERYSRRKQEIGTNVFIGHGRSPVWRDLKDFVRDRLKLPWDEFNRVPMAGISNIDRLLQMLDDAAIAFLIMTAEDELADGKMRARENVVHEAGLFQGRLGFSKAIVLIEDGCEEFSNIHGLGQIRFPKEDIRPAFEEIRRVLEREGLIEL